MTFTLDIALDFDGVEANESWGLTLDEESLVMLSRMTVNEDKDEIDGDDVLTNKIPNF